MNCGKTCKEDRDDEWMGVSLARQPTASGSVLVSSFPLISLEQSLSYDSNAKHVKINVLTSDWQRPAFWAANLIVPSFKRKGKGAPAKKAYL